MPLIPKTLFYALAVAFLIVSAPAQVSLTSGSYSQNFDALGTNASSVWANNTSLPGWFALSALTNPSVITNQTGSGTAGDLANFSSSTTDTNRSLGWVVAGSIGALGTYASIGFGVSNNTGASLESFSFSYTGREWRGYSNNTPALYVQYKLGGTFDNDASNSLSGSGWVDVSPLSFVLPVTNNNLPVNGLVAPNYSTLSNTVSGISWTPGQVLWIRWRQQNLPGGEAQLSIDDVALTASGPNVQIVSTINSAGSVQSNGSVQIASFVGELGAVSSGSNVVVRQGANSMVYYAAGFSVTADSLAINEQGSPDSTSARTQLRGNIVYDDTSLSPVDQSQVTWAAPATNSPLASISATGLAQAATVYQNTAASFSGSYSGVLATNVLTVLNVLSDNYSVWAGDTFDDAWEIAQGMSGAVNPNAINNGVPYWLLYAMGYNLTQPPPSTFNTSAVTNGYLTVSYTRNPYATNYTFAPQEAGDLSVGFTNMVNPVSVTNLANGVQQVVTFGSLPINATNKQFLRVKIGQPSP